jgi:hypothetical protein
MQNPPAWLYAVFGLLAAAVFATPFFGSDDLGLEVVLETPLFQKSHLAIRNVGRGVVTINRIDVNEEEKCRAFLVDYSTGTNWVGEKPAPIAFEPKPLSVGQGAIWVTPCSVVRAQIITDRGREEYTFVQQ